MNSIAIVNVILGIFFKLIKQMQKKKPIEGFLLKKTCSQKMGPRKLFSYSLYICPAKLNTRSEATLGGIARILQDFGAKCTVDSSPLLLVWLNEFA